MLSSFGRPSNEHDRYIVLSDCSRAAIRTRCRISCKRTFEQNIGSIIFHVVYNDFYIIFNTHNIKYECTQYAGI